MRSENKRACHDDVRDCRDAFACGHLFSLVPTSSRITRAGKISRSYLSREYTANGTKRGIERKRKRGENTRVIPVNFREIALTSFSRGHIAIANAARPPRVHFMADSATNFTDAATNIAIGNSFWIPWWCRCRNFRSRRIYRARTQRQRRPGPSSPHMFSPLGPFLSAGPFSLLLEETVPVRNETG